MNNQIIVPNVYNSSPDEFFDGSAYIPREKAILSCYARNVVIKLTQFYTAGITTMK